MSYYDDQHENDSTMLDNIAEVADEVVGHRIIEVNRDVALPAGSSRWYYGGGRGLELVLDNGTRVYLSDTSDCCAYTELEAIIEHLPEMDHIITAVQQSDGFEKWHFIADLGEVLELQVGWSEGNPYYYGYGFDVAVTR